MEKLSILRSLYRSTRLRSHNHQPILLHGFRHYTAPPSSSYQFFIPRTIAAATASSLDRMSLECRMILYTAPPSSSYQFFIPRTIAAATASSPDRTSLGCRHSSSFGIGSSRSYCECATQLPIIRDPDIQNVFKDFIATSWDDVPDSLINNAMKALSKNTKDSAGREALANVLRAAEAVEEFGGILVTLRMEIDDIIGMSGEKIGPLPDEHVYALDEVYKRYNVYLDAFDPDEEYLRKKVEIELGTKMIHLKMRCSFLDSQWGKNAE